MLSGDDMRDPLAILENCVCCEGDYVWMMTQMNSDVNDCSQNHCHHFNTGCDES